jgi:AcrR family transcriptional regulator
VASSSGQSGRPDYLPKARSAAAAPTRERLMAAAAELIAERGWGRVTTRAVAERAGLPHGTVSYHFRGKQALLSEAALHAFERALPLEQFAALESVDDFLGFVAAEVGDPEAIDPVLSRLMLEAMREAERDGALRERLGGLLGDYRRLLVEVVRADQERGAAFAGAPPEGLAALLAAAGDGLLLHILLDPALDSAGAVAALRALLQPRAAGA